MQNIRIYTGAKGSGKTTSLLEYCNNDNNTAGILTPIINGKRCFYDIASKAVFDMEYANELNDTAIAVGKYFFSKNAFNKANNILKQINATTEIVIDEIGPLELKNSGFASVLKELLQQDNVNLLLVVREGLVQNVIDYFSLKNVTIITSI